MVDYILAVQSPPDWHAANIQQNRHHYSALSYLGPQAVDWVAERIGVGVHFNTLVPSRDRVSAMFKMIVLCRTKTFRLSDYVPAGVLLRSLQI